MDKKFIRPEIKEKRCHMLRLRPYKPADAEFVLKWWEGIGEDDFMKWGAGKFSYPLTMEQLEYYYETWGIKETTGWPMTALDEEGRVVGQLLMRIADFEAGTLRFGFIVVDPELRGKGYGKQMLTQALRYAHEILGMKKASLGVFDNNPQARKCYEQAGFSLTGEISDYLKAGGRNWAVCEMEAVFHGE